MTAARMSASSSRHSCAARAWSRSCWRSDHQDAKTVWAIFGPAVGWSFIGIGLYAWRRRPESRTGALMVLLGFAWFLSALNVADSPLVYTFALVLGGLWGGVFLHLGLGFPSGRLRPGRDRALVHRGLPDLPAGLRCRPCCSPRRTSWAATTARPTCC